MKKAMKIISLLLAMMLLASCGSGTATQAPAASQATTASAAAGETKAAAETAAETAAAAPADIYQKYDPPIDMVAVRNVQLADTEVDFSKSIWIAQYKDVLGVNLSYKLQAYGEQYDNKVNMLLASNDLADVMQVNLRQLYQMIDADQIQDLQPAWDAYATEMTETAMKSDGTQNFDMVSRDGKLYGIPSVNPAIETAHAVFIREDWRTKLNLPEPKTYEDLEKIMYAFANDDPDGNGVKDTFGLSINKDLFTDGHDVSTFFNLFAAYPDAWVVGDDGNLVYGGMLPGMKTGLGRLQQFYQDGLIDKEFTVKDQAKAAENMVKEKVGVFFGIQWAGFIGDGVISLYKNTEGKTSWKSYQLPVSDPKGGPIMYNTTKTFYVVRKGYEHPEALVNMVNYIHFMGRTGPTDTSPWKIEKEKWQPLWDDWQSALIVPETIHNNVQRWLDTFEAIEKKDTTKIDACYLTKGLYDGLNEWKLNGKDYRNTTTMEPSFDDAALWSELETCGQTFMNTLANKKAGTLQSDMVGSFVSETMLEKQATLDKLELETITRIITGDAPVDEYDNYVKQWNNLGGTQITQELNEWYATIK